MFQRVLIANRGEIAVRVLQTCQGLGIETVAAHSQADAGAPWVRRADASICVGPAQAARSYLDPVALVQAAVDLRCSAIHPGYGFLAENSLFAALCHQAGVAFIGPRPKLIDLLGGKSPAKQAFARVGIAGVPGSDGPVADLHQAQALVQDIGFPVLLKAEGGGGGRGMRRVDAEEELEQAWNEAQREAGAAFGNPALLMERYMDRPRHIEYQILVDNWGKGVHLFERECSIQRRHQKLLEESPSPALTPKQRQEFGDRVAEAVAAIGYTGAGTVEFLMDPSGELFFIEMNARLQVEHPVSECVTGIDLVQWQLRIAAGQALDLHIPPHPKGHAIEVRINAEDPNKDFAPCPGTVTRFDIPRELGPGTVRVDTFLSDGETISPHYDSMVAKVIAHGATREEAIETLSRALASACIEGVPTTLDLQRRILAHPAFASGALHTGFLDEHKLLEEGD